jgi:hypothetical protein
MCKRRDAECVIESCLISIRKNNVVIWGEKSGDMSAANQYRFRTSWAFSKERPGVAW